MLETLKHKLRQQQYDWMCGDVLKTAPIRTRGDGPVLFSMISHAALRPYLVAAKSLRHKLGTGHFAILSDGTLTPEDRAILHMHLDNPEITDARDVDRGPCPAGGCWERLIRVLELAKSNYVIQFDSDILCLHEPSEVLAAINKQQDFTLLGDSAAAAAGLVSAATMRDWRHVDPQHIQARAERLLISLPNSAELRYVRGCAGFAGFAQGPSRLAQLFAFSEHMQAQLGADWSIWGTEQVASNFIIANSAAPQLLNYDQYLNHEGWSRSMDDPAFDGQAHIMHFIGTFRYKKGRYIKLSQDVIDTLNS